MFQAMVSDNGDLSQETVLEFNKISLSEIIAASFAHQVPAT